MPTLEQMVRRQRVLANFGDFALRSDGLDEVLMEACRLAGEALGTGRAKILEIEHESQTLLVRAGVGWKPEIIGEMRLKMSERSSVSFSIKAGRPVVSQDIGKEDRFEVPAFMREVGVVALVNTPIFLPGGRAYGLLEVDSTEPRAFGEQEVEFLRTFASILGPVVDRLHQISQLRVTEERFRLIIENARDYAIFVTDEEDRITDWLPGAEAVFGWTASEAVGQPSSILFTPEDRERHEDIKEFETTRQEGIAPNVRWHVRKDGKRVFIDGTVTALRDRGGGLRGTLKIGQDVTERRRVDEQLRESEARFRHMADSAPALIWMTDEEGQVVFANMHFGHLFGRSPTEMLGNGWASVVLADDLPGFTAGFEHAFRARQSFRAEVQVRDRAGRVVWLRCESVPRLDDTGRFLGYTGCGVDITEARLAAEELEHRVSERTAELMRAEETIRQAQKMEAVGQLTGGIAHDFNNMLQGVAGGLEMALRRIHQDRAGEAGRYIEAAQEAVGRATGLTRRLLAFARRQRLEPKPVNADELVTGLAELIRRTVGPAIYLDLRLRDGAGSVLCDANELESALLNLCINARDAMPEGGWLTIGTEDVSLSSADIPDGEAPGQYVAISVADTGTGMPPEVLGRVFEPFFTTKPQGQGTGLGLSQIYGFVRQSDGLVRIESMPGRGTTVRLLLPLRHSVETTIEAQQPMPPQLAGSRKTVLLVDDEDAVRQPAADRLRELGYIVLEARDGPSALQALVSAQPDLLVTDVGLPDGMNGRQLAEVVRERVPELPVLFITGYAGTPLPLGTEVIGKPFDLDTLARRVQGLLQGSGKHPGA